MNVYLHQLAHANIQAYIHQLNSADLTAPLDTSLSISAAKFKQNTRTRRNKDNIHSMIAVAQRKTPLLSDLIYYEQLITKLDVSNETMYTVNTLLRLLKQQYYANNPLYSHTFTSDISAIIKLLNQAKRRIRVIKDDLTSKYFDASLNTQVDENETARLYKKIILCDFIKNLHIYPKDNRYLELFMLLDTLDVLAETDSKLLDIYNQVQLHIDMSQQDLDVTPFS